mmetsp:Transcript_8222/g.12234  ORF Transcript_8222/g.12234 Transcript_8222/m.12234 type:complete len:201 (+) Transcript_8222:1450-2052(+)
MILIVLHPAMMMMVMLHYGHWFAHLMLLLLTMIDLPQPLLSRRHCYFLQSVAPMMMHHHSLSQSPVLPEVHYHHLLSYQYPWHRYCSYLIKHYYSCSPVPPGHDSHSRSNSPVFSTISQPLPVAAALPANYCNLVPYVHSPPATFPSVPAAHSTPIIRRLYDLPARSALPVLQSIQPYVPPLHLSKLESGYLIVPPSMHD